MANRTALVLLCPAAQKVLGDLRVRYFRNLARRMPAHVTMLFPFRSPVDDETLSAVADIAARLSPIDATFRSVGRFRRDVVWLLPEPEAEFARASDAVLAKFPDCAPYSGAHAHRSLHLTVASRLRDRESDRLVDEVSDVLPIRDRIDELTLMAETGTGWRTERSWPLGAT
jgi:hypothetical protein